VPRCLRVVCVIPMALISAFLCSAQTELPDPPPATVPSFTPQALPSSWDDGLWAPLQHWVKSLFERAPAGAPASRPTPSPTPATTAFEAESGCSVAPLDSLEDASALQLEASSDVADVSGMLPAAARALNLFAAKVASVGGTMVLKSAYRPAAYQRHLQNVWYKWMSELKKNDDPACQVLRADVQQEFTRHHLIETQHPVGVSDHTRGLAFDATVDLPTPARNAKRHPALDALARMAGLLRPAIVTDPVHFKFLGVVRPARLLVSRRRHNA
jgi:hypothetical protein